MLDRASLLGYALVACGAAFLLVYPLAISGRPAGPGITVPPFESRYFMMIVGVYATLGVFLLLASRDPRWHLDLIWFTIWSSLVHAGIMGVQTWRSRRQAEGPGRARSLVKQKLIYSNWRDGASQDRRPFDAGHPEIDANEPKTDAAMQRDGRLRGESLLAPG